MPPIPKDSVTEESTVVASQCRGCIHAEDPYHCPAFAPDKLIPFDIVFNDFDHRNPYPGDHGVRWTPKTPTTKHPMGATPA